MLVSAGSPVCVCVCVCMCVRARTRACMCMCAANSSNRNSSCALCCFRFAGFIMGMTSACSCALTLTAPYVTATLLVTVSLLFSPCRHVTICLLSYLIAFADKGDPPQPLATPQVSVFLWLNYHSSRSSTNERQSSSHRRSHSSTQSYRVQATGVRRGKWTFSSNLALGLTSPVSSW